MTYHAVLTSIRELILDGIELPVSESQRCALLLQRNPDLSLAEAEDLAKIDPKHLQIYSNSIFAQERSVLRDKYQLSFALIKVRWRQRHGSSFDFFELVKQQHKLAPWRDNKTESLIRNFHDFVLTHRADLVELIVELKDALRFELRQALISRSVLSDPISNQTSLLALSEMSIADALALKVELAPNSSAQSWDYDIYQLKKRFRIEGDSALLEPAIHSPHAMIISRSPELAVVCNQVPKGFVSALSDISANGKVNRKTSLMQELATCFLEQQTSLRAENELFTDFIQLIAKLVRDNAVILLRNNESIE